MQVEKELAKLRPEKETLLTIGVFDGVHLGHKYLLRQLIKQARAQGLLSGVVTFNQHPQEVLSPQAKPSFLTDLVQRIDLIRKEGVEAIFTLSFTRELARLSARRFLDLLKKYLRMRGLVIGSDFALGENREGDADTLRTLGREMDFGVTVIPLITVNGEVVSSTTVRNALANGDMNKVHQLIGRPFSLEGRVTKGVGRGIALGFPTANLDIDRGQALPADGVYATWCYIDGQPYPSTTYIGKQPTFGSSQRTVEVYVLDYHSDLYGRELKIELIERLRADKRFATAEELKKQIAEDIMQGRARLTPK